MVLRMLALSIPRLATSFRSPQSNANNSATLAGSSTQHIERRAPLSQRLCKV